MTRENYFDAFVRNLEQGRFSLLLAVKGFPLDGAPSNLCYQLGEAVLTAMQAMTPRQLLELFPLDKNYDGNKIGCKDYFYCMDFLKDYGMNQRINKPADFLWDYLNRDTREFFISWLSCAGKIYKRLTGKSAVQQAMECARLPYRAFTGDNLYYMEFDGQQCVAMPNLPEWIRQGLLDAAWGNGKG